MLEETQTSPETTGPTLEACLNSLMFICGRSQEAQKTSETCPKMTKCLICSRFLVDCPIDDECFRGK